MNAEHDTHDLPARASGRSASRIGIACVLVGLVVSARWSCVGAVDRARLRLPLGARLSREHGPRRRRAEPEALAADVAPRPATEAELGDDVDRATFLSVATLGLGGLIGARRDAARRSASRVLPSFIGEGVEHDDVDLGPISNFPEGQYVIATFLENPEQGEVSRRTAFIRNNGLHRRRRAELHDHLQPLRAPRLPGAAERADRRGGEEGRQRRRAPAGARRRASAARATAASTTPRATARPARPSARSTATSSRSCDGNLVLGSLFSVGTVEGTGASARITKYYKAYPGRARRRHRALALPDSDPGRRADPTMARRPRASTSSQSAALYPLDWVEERSGLVGVHKWFLFRKVPQRHQLGADARLGDADGVPRPGDDRRDPRDVLQARPGQRVRLDPEHHERARRSAGSCAACTSGARASSSS